MKAAMTMRTYQRSMTWISSILKAPSVACTNAVKATNLLSSSSSPRAVAFSTVSTSNVEKKFDSCLTLYQYAICPYCNIAKAILNYTKTPFQLKEVNPLTKKELKSLPDTEYRKVPILLVKTESDIQQINGSESIVNHFLSTSEIDTTSISSQKWTAFARDDLAPLLYPNLCNTLGNSYAAFGYVHSVNSPFTLVERYSIQIFGSVAMYLAASKIKSTWMIQSKPPQMDALSRFHITLVGSHVLDSFIVEKRGIVDEQAALMDALDEFNDALKGEFLDPVAKNPHLGDLTIFGVLRGLKGLPIMRSIHDNFPVIHAWYQRMQLRVEKKNAEIEIV